MKNHLSLWLILAGVATPILAETYEEPRIPPEVELRDNEQYYTDLIAEQRKLTYPGGPADNLIAAATIGNGPGRVSELPSDTYQIGRTGKLRDAASFAEQGKEGTSAALLSLVGDYATFKLTYCNLGGACDPYMEDQFNKLEKKFDDLGKTALAMEYALVRNDEGRIRLLDPETGSQLGYDDDATKGGGGKGALSSNTSASGGNSKSSSPSQSESQEVLEEFGLDTPSLMKTLKAAADSGETPSTAIRDLLREQNLSASDLSRLSDAIGDTQSSTGGIGSSGGAGFGNGKEENSKGRGFANSDGGVGDGAENGAERTLAGSGSGSVAGGRGTRKKYYGGTIEPVTALGRLMNKFPQLRARKAKPAGRIQKIPYREVLALKDNGILVPRRGDNIFEKANSVYRRFDRYRETPLVRRKVVTDRLFAFD